MSNTLVVNSTVTLH